MGFLRKYRNYAVGFFVWAISIASVLAIPKIIAAKKHQQSLSSFGSFMATLSVEQKERLASFDGGIISAGNQYFLIDSSSTSEYDLRKSDLIEYKVLPEISDENTRRLVIVNTILKSLATEERDQILARKAAIVYRNNEFILIKLKSGIMPIK